jgi:hypothetical protein
MVTLGRPVTVILGRLVTVTIGRAVVAAGPPPLEDIHCCHLK